MLSWNITHPWVYLEEKTNEDFDWYRVIKSNSPLEYQKYEPSFLLENSALKLTNFFKMYCLFS
jgi:hypothetical protein